ncbi:MAG: aa3-type cytochrome c oxidase subunit IV [Rhodospirillaceae bacterium]|jgi:hypothetical protein|nr:aa3-type cytochrome c oxidase subunit IV [Rhodospirillaceae bacterium]MBT6138557.1 aa3-type cytochrome c oxidase subunit IV [Rhodospirillaceae bacterium]
MVPPSATLGEDVRRHREFYDAWCSFLKVSTGLTILTLVLMAIFLV